MTENTTTTELPEGIERLVPAGLDALDDLHVVELAATSRRIGCDVVEAVQQDTDGKRWDGLLHLCLTWAKRADTKATLEPYKQLSGPQLFAVLGINDDDDQREDDDQEDANPTDGAPA